MNSFEFVARMWRGARAMTELQEELLGEVISLDGQGRKTTATCWATGVTPTWRTSSKLNKKVRNKD